MLLPGRDFKDFKLQKGQKGRRKQRNREFIDTIFTSIISILMLLPLQVDYTKWVLSGSVKTRREKATGWYGRIYTRK